MSSPERRASSLGGGTTRPPAHPNGRGHIDFAAINDAALRQLPSLLDDWLPGGRLRGREYIPRNPTRSDRRPGSFSVNVETGEWADFAIEGAKGGDVVSLCAYLKGLSQKDAARWLAEELGLDLEKLGFDPEGKHERAQRPLKESSWSTLVP